MGLKAFDGREKSISRVATKDVVPSSILSCQKSSYPSTQDSSYEAELRHQLTTIVDDPNNPVSPLLDRAAITDLLKTPLGEIFPMYDRMGTKLVVGLNMTRPLRRRGRDLAKKRRKRERT